MTPEEKAKELIDKYYILLGYSDCNTCVSESLRFAKKNVLIVVDEMLKELNNYCYTKSIEYWQQVKLEIEKL